MWPFSWCCEIAANICDSSSGVNEFVVGGSVLASSNFCSRGKFGKICSCSLEKVMDVVSAKVRSLDKLYLRSCVCCW